jgi:hypothetical protein
MILLRRRWWKLLQEKDERCGKWEGEARFHGMIYILGTTREQKPNMALSGMRQQIRCPFGSLHRVRAQPPGACTRETHHERSVEGSVVEQLLGTRERNGMSVQDRNRCGWKYSNGAASRIGSTQQIWQQRDGMR